MKNPTNIFNAATAAGLFLAATIQVGATVTMYQTAVIADPDAIALWSFDGATAGTRQSDSKGTNNLNTFTEGSGSATAISYGGGFDASSSAVTPQRINDNVGAAFITSSTIAMPAAASFEAIVAPGALGDSYGYIFGARATSSTRNYFGMQRGNTSPNQDLITTSGNNFNDGQSTIVDNYTTDSWYYIAVTLTTDGTDTIVNSYFANLTAGDTLLTQAATNVSEGGTFQNTIAYGVGILNDNGGSNQAFKGKIDEIALYGAAKDQAFFQANLTTIIPEPSSVALLGLGSVALLLRRRRK